MSTEANKVLIRRWGELWNAGDAAAIAALVVSPSTTALCSGAVGPSRKPSTRQTSAGGASDESTDRSPARFDR